MAQEADDMEETLLGRESRLCWFWHRKQQRDVSEKKKQIEEES